MAFKRALSPLIRPNGGGGGIILGTAVASTSGTAIDFTGIPSGVARISLILSSVRVSASSVYNLILGDSGGFETSGYAHSSAVDITSSSTSGTYSSAAFITKEMPSTTSGLWMLNLIDLTSNNWVCTHHFGYGGGNNRYIGGGRKALTTELTQIRLTADGIVTFTAGTVGIVYELKG